MSSPWGSGLPSHVGRHTSTAERIGDTGANLEGIRTCGENAARADLIVQVFLHSGRFIHPGVNRTTMAYLDWNGGVGGVQTMDHERGRLVKYMNALHSRCQAGAPRPIVARALQALYDEALTHFRHEEAYLRQQAYAGYAAHRETHRKLMQEPTRFRDAFVIESAELDEEFFGFLERRLCVHILGADVGYGHRAAA